MTGLTYLMSKLSARTYTVIKMYIDSRPQQAVFGNGNNVFRFHYTCIHGSNNKWKVRVIKILHTHLRLKF